MRSSLSPSASTRNINLDELDLIHGNVTPPSAYFESLRLDDRLEEVCSWVSRATSKAYSDRSHSFLLAQSIESLKKRSQEHVKICECLELRLKEIDETEKAFHSAYDACKKQLDTNSELKEYRLSMRSAIIAREKNELLVRDKERMAVVKKKIAFNKEKEKRKDEKLRKKALWRSNDEKRDGNLFQPDRTEEASIEGAGDKIITSD
jgi:hypothetical protein